MEEKENELVAIFVPRRIKNKLKALTVDQDCTAMYQMIEHMQNYYEAGLESMHK